MSSMKSIWNKLHQNPRFMPLYPHEEVIRWFYKYTDKKDLEDVTILDLGCGAGRHAIFFAQQGCNTHACDLSIKGLNKVDERAKNLGLNIKTKQVSADDLACYADDSFDYICCYGVLYYLTLDSAKQSIAEINRILKPNGHLLLTVRTTDDSRCQNQQKISACTWRLSSSLEAPSSSESNMDMLFFTLEDIERLLNKKFTYSVNHMIFKTAEYQNDDWVIYCEKV